MNWINMKVQSIKQQNNSFGGLSLDKVTDFVAQNPGVVASLAGASVVAQKAIQSTAEVAFAPNIDVWIGKAITEITDEKDGRTNQSSKVQAIRTIAQTVGGSITGIIIRLLCVGGMTALLVKTGGKVGENIAKVSEKTGGQNLYELQRKAAAIGKSAGGLLATFIMMFTNFLLDVPIINFINKKLSEIVLKEDKNKEVKNG